jgi:DNA-binding NtrC family response regulator
MKSQPVLIVEDDQTCQLALRRILETEGYAVTLAVSVEEAKALCQKGPFHLLISDLRLPDGDGIDLMEHCRKLIPDLPCVMLTGFASINTAVEATRRGAFDFIQKPFEKEHLLVAVRNALDQYKLKRQNTHLKTETNVPNRFEKMIGRSPRMLEVFDMVKKVADTDSTILIRGESGTGKELIARAIHQRSKRAEQLMVPINCGAIPRDLLESELFGHVKGAFTGAIANRTGRFEIADGGTLFLDEIAEMTPALQVKLLRVLQEQAFEPIGATRTVHVDTRIIAATNQNLEQMIKEKIFREDLFYRLNVIPIWAPPLRERREDIPLLADFFLQTFNRMKNRRIEGIQPHALELMEHYAWPGNVRELENLIERLVILKGEGIIGVEDLPEKIQRSSSISVTTTDKEPGTFTAPQLPVQGLSFNDVVDQFENGLILQALERTHWNRNRAATLLGLNRTTLVEKIKKKGLGRFEPSGPTLGESPALDA